MSLFDGLNGHSNGKTNGLSALIMGAGGTKNIRVFGEFGGALVTLKFKVGDDVFSTNAVWSDSNVFQGLSVKSGEFYLLEISGATDTTDLTAEVF